MRSWWGATGLRVGINTSGDGGSRAGGLCYHGFWGLIGQINRVCVCEGNVGGGGMVGVGGTTCGDGGRPSPVVTSVGTSCLTRLPTHTYNTTYYITRVNYINGVNYPLK